MHVPAYHHAARRGRVVDGAEREAAQRVAASTVLKYKRHDLLLERLRHRHLLTADAHVRATVQYALGRALDEHLR